MAKKVKIFSIICINIISFHSTKAQTTDSINCGKYFSELEKTQLITLWSKPPLLKEKNAPILCELCDMIANDSCENIVATLILDKIGIPICAGIYSEIINDSLKSRIIKLLYQLEFEPAIGHQTPVISHYLLIVNSKKCKMYKGMNEHKKKKKSQ